MPDADSGHGRVDARDCSDSPHDCLSIWRRWRPQAALPTGRPLHLPGAWYVSGMRSTIDKAGRLVIPKTLRDSLGLVPGEVEVTADGAGLHIEPLADDRLEDEDGLLVIPAADVTVSDDLVRMLRDADQR